MTDQLNLSKTRQEIDALCDLYNQSPCDENARPIYGKMSAIAAAYRAGQNQGTFVSPEDRYQQDVFAGVIKIPEVDALEFTAEKLASAILFHGALIVRGLFDSDAVDFLMEGVRYAEKLELYDDKDSYAQLHLLKLYQVYKSSGLLGVMNEYQGGQAVMMAERARINRRLTDPSLVHFGLPWHQDMPFFGRKSFAVNCWSALTDCGGDNIGLRIVPRRLDRAIGWDHEGPAALDYGAVSREEIMKTVQQGKNVIPVFKAGDAILFDELTLHGTKRPKYDFGVRYTASTWFFHWSNSPERSIPLGF